MRIWGCVKWMQNRAEPIPAKSGEGVASILGPEFTRLIPMMRQVVRWQMRFPMGSTLWACVVGLPSGCGCLLRAPVPLFQGVRGLGDRVLTVPTGPAALLCPDPLDTVQVPPHHLLGLRGIGHASSAGTVGVLGVARCWEWRIEYTPARSWSGR